jgi:hypothetical protein
MRRKRRRAQASQASKPDSALVSAVLCSHPCRAQADQRLDEELANMFSTRVARRRVIRRKPFLAVVLGLVLLLGSVALHAQVVRGGGGRSYPPRRPTGGAGGEFVFSRLEYRSVRNSGSGSGWTTDYPAADINFMIRFDELTTAPVSMAEPGYPNHVVVRPLDRELFDFPFLFSSDVGTIVLNDAEAERLRDYLLKGGFWWVDDFWGHADWAQWESQIARVLPPWDYPVFDIPMTHPIVAALHRIERIPQISNIGFWRRSGGATSEQGAASDQVNFRGIADEKGRLLVIMTHNTDIADGWEREVDDLTFFSQFSVESYAIGLTFAVYAMSQ